MILEAGDKIDGLVVFIALCPFENISLMHRNLTIPDEGLKYLGLCLVHIYIQPLRIKEISVVPHLNASS